MLGVDVLPKLLLQCRNLWTHDELTVIKDGLDVPFDILVESTAAGRQGL